MPTALGHISSNKLKVVPNEAVNLNQIKNDSMSSRALQKYKRKAELAEMKLELMMSGIEPRELNELYLVIFYLRIYFT